MTEVVSALTADAGESANPNGRVIDLILPVLVLIVTCTLGMIYVGGFFGVDMSGNPSFAGDFIGAFGNTNAFVGLPWGGIIALVLTVIYLVARKVLSFKEAMACVPKGFIAMVPPIIILTLAVSLKAMINSLGADVYVHDLMFAASKSLYSMLPAVIFVVACILAFASGTSWGTFGILIPIVTAVFPADSTLLIIGISACCAGAVCGDHCSPISDTTIMASAGAQCLHLDHVSTQLPYAVTVAIVSFVGFIVAGFVQNVLITWLVSAALLLGVLLFLRARERKQADVEIQRARRKAKSEVEDMRERQFFWDWGYLCVIFFSFIQNGAFQRDLLQLITVPINWCRGYVAWFEQLDYMGYSTGEVVFERIFSSAVIMAGIVGCVLLVWGGIEQYRKIWDEIYKMVLIASFSFIAVLGNLIREYLPFNLLFVIFVINVGAVLIRIYLNNKNVGY